MSGNTVVSVVDKGWTSGEASVRGDVPGSDAADAAVTVDEAAAKVLIAEDDLASAGLAGSGFTGSGTVMEFPAAAPPAAAPASAPVAAQVEGYIDGLDARWNVVGWARSFLAVDERLKVELVEDGQAVSAEMAMRFRGDLLDAGRGDGQYGFQLSIPAHLFDGLRHRLSVRVAAPAQPAVLGQLDIVLPSRLPKSAGVEDSPSKISAARLVESVLGGGMAQPAHALDGYVRQLSEALSAVAQNFDFTTALGLLYVHVLRRRIDEGGLKSRLTQLLQDPDRLGHVVREVVLSEEAQGRIKRQSGYCLPDLEAIRAWTRLRPVV